MQLLINEVYLLHYVRLNRIPQREILLQAFIEISLRIHMAINS